MSNISICINLHVFYRLVSLIPYKLTSETVHPYCHRSKYAINFMIFCIILLLLLITIAWANRIEEKAFFIALFCCCCCTWYMDIYYNRFYSGNCYCWSFSRRPRSVQPSIVFPTTDKLIKQFILEFIMWTIVLELPYHTEPCDVRNIFLIMAIFLF